VFLARKEYLCYSLSIFVISLVSLPMYVKLAFFYIEI
jgi:hypothetical protein